MRRAVLLAAALSSLALTVDARELRDTGGPGPEPRAAGRAPDPSLADSFVQIQADGAGAKRFVLGCAEFPVAGFNEWEVCGVMEMGAGAQPAGSKLPPTETGAQDYPSMLAPGQLNEGLMRGLDYALDEARKRGIKARPRLRRAAAPAGQRGFKAGEDGRGHARAGRGGTGRGGAGRQQSSSVTAQSPALPPTWPLPPDLTRCSSQSALRPPTNQDLFKSYVQSIVSRVNTINGRTYAEDPTIMAWDLINEPVCRDCPPGTIAAWVKEMAAYVKSLDSNHLLTIGEEGFYRTTASSVSANPSSDGSQWATEWDQAGASSRLGGRHAPADFVVDHSDSNIDYASFHAWPDLWKCLSCSQALPLDFFSKWIAQHVADAGRLGKPVVLEEFGKAIDGGGRDAYYQAAFQAVEDSLRSGGPLKGALFWQQLYANGQTASDGEGGGAGKFGVYPDSSTFQLVKANAAAVAQLSARAVTQCSKLAAPLALPACSPGCTTVLAAHMRRCHPCRYEGPKCDLDINECARGTAGCAAGAVCVNSPGSYRCECPLGTNGDGTSGACSNDTTAQAQALGQFWNDPHGQASAGWREDQTGKYERDPAFKVLAERLWLCSCLAAPGCEAFTVNEVQHGCFLKAKQCPLNNNCQGPPLMCSSLSDLGQNITLPCGTWTTWYRDTINPFSNSGDAHSRCNVMLRQVTDLHARLVPLEKAALDQTKVVVDAHQPEVVVDAVAAAAALTQTPVSLGGPKYNEKELVNAKGDLPTKVQAEALAPLHAFNTRFDDTVLKQRSVNKAYDEVQAAQKRVDALKSKVENLRLKSQSSDPKAAASLQEAQTTLQVAQDKLTAATNKHDVEEQEQFARVGALVLEAQTLRGVVRAALEQLGLSFLAARDAIPPVDLPGSLPAGFTPTAAQAAARPVSFAAQAATPAAAVIAPH
eukprot:scaffold3.g6508.t1